MPKLAFIHVPKTGGSAFVGTIIDYWPKELVSPYTGIKGFIEDADPSKYHFTAGHVFYEKMKELLSPDRSYMTIMREPVQRVYSHYNHVRKFKQTLAQSIEEFVYDSSDSPLAHNLMARYYAWWTEDFNKNSTHWTAELERTDIPISDDELYKRARANLEEFWHVGTQEKWIETVQIVHEWLDKPMPDVVQKNAEDYRKIMSKSLIKDLEKYNRVDMELYREVCNGKYSSITSGEDR